MIIKGFLGVIRYKPDIKTKNIKRKRRRTVENGVGIFLELCTVSMYVVVDPST